MVLSIVVPCYNEESNIDVFYEEICRISPELPDDTSVELIFVNDGSKDNTLLKIRELTNKDESVRYVSFTRNFGKESAMLAGFEAASGDYICVMDADLQDPPSMIPEMYALICTGEYDRIATRRVNRKGEPPVRSFFAHMFYRMINKLSDVRIVDGARDFSIMSRRMIDSIIDLKEKTRFTKGLLEWPGYRTKWLEFKNRERNKGRSKWSFFKLFSYSIEGIVSFSNKPLIISALLGVILCIISLVMVFVVALRRIIFGDPVEGWASLVCIILFVSGLQHLSIGIIGSYLARLFIEIKGRPLYIIDEEKTERK